MLVTSNDDENPGLVVYFLYWPIAGPVLKVYFHSLP